MGKSFKTLLRLYIDYYINEYNVIYVGRTTPIDKNLRELIQELTNRCFKSYNWGDYNDKMQN